MYGCVRAQFYSAHPQECPWGIYCSIPALGCDGAVDVCELVATVSAMERKRFALTTPDEFASSGTRYFAYISLIARATATKMLNTISAEMIKIG
mmetsp:Transcript_22917/g.58275  ORF Transcript_22917/g.58275 Transcript_22917/m.58275 type:complete len:94 (+) Transcript_22917:105-386(+)